MAIVVVVKNDPNPCVHPPGCSGDVDVVVTLEDGHGVNDFYGINRSLLKSVLRGKKVDLYVYVDRTTFPITAFKSPKNVKPSVHTYSSKIAGSKAGLTRLGWKNLATSGAKNHIKFVVHRGVSGQTSVFYVQVFAHGAKPDRDLALGTGLGVINF